YCRFFGGQKDQATFCACHLVIGTRGKFFAEIGIGKWPMPAFAAIIRNDEFAAKRLHGEIGVAKFNRLVQRDGLFSRGCERSRLCQRPVWLSVQLPRFSSI